MYDMYRLAQNKVAIKNALVDDLLWCGSVSPADHVYYSVLLASVSWSLPYNYTLNRSFRKRGFPQILQSSDIRIEEDRRVLAKAAKEGGPLPFLEQILFDVVRKYVKTHKCVLI